MSNWIECPACDAEFAESKSCCPHCGLPQEVAMEILSYRAAGANKKLLEKISELERKLAEMTTANRVLNYRLNEIERTLNAIPPVDC